jgi:hypothetical protein
VLRDKSMNGYMLLSKSALDREKLLASLHELTAQALVRTSGEITVERMGESFFSIPMEALGYVDQLLGRIRGVQYR